jgi:alpha-L-rhamnosidase
VRPHFTYYGFRFVRVTGWLGELNSADFIGKVVYSDLVTTSAFTSFNKMLNQLVSNCIWGQRSNFLNMPTDCPQRDERLGWTGDAQVFSPNASFNMDTRAFYRKFLYDSAKLMQLKKVEE